MFPFNLFPFNKQKCKTLHLGHGNNKHVYTIQGVPLKQVTEERDLGVVVDECLKFRRQATEAVSKAIECWERSGVHSPISIKLRFQSYIKLW